MFEFTNYDNEHLNIDSITNSYSHMNRSYQLLEF